MAERLADAVAHPAPLIVAQVGDELLRLLDLGRLDHDDHLAIAQLDTVDDELADGALRVRHVRSHEGIGNAAQQRGLQLLADRHQLTSLRSPTILRSVARLRAKRKPIEASAVPSANRSASSMCSFNTARRSAVASCSRSTSPTRRAAKAALRLVLPLPPLCTGVAAQTRRSLSL